MTEYEFVEHMLGNSYQDNRIAIERIQIFSALRLPPEKQVKELLGQRNFPVTIIDTAHPADPSLNAIQNQQFENLLRTNILRNTSMGDIINISDGMSLPNDIVYLKSPG
ncbi:MAG: hypothetical protein LBH70_03905 [Spirochaetaceae bacterium]|jgi:hypothetical protein|nr:hypothetical protein [Spirochaetaceae bacterium]